MEPKDLGHRQQPQKVDGPLGDDGSPLQNPFALPADAPVKILRCPHSALPLQRGDHVLGTTGGASGHPLPTIEASSTVAAKIPPVLVPGGLRPPGGGHLPPDPGEEPSHGQTGEEGEENQPQQEKEERRGRLPPRGGEERVEGQGAPEEDQPPLNLMDPSKALAQMSRILGHPSPAKALQLRRDRKEPLPPGRREDPLLESLAFPSEGGRAEPEATPFPGLPQVGFETAGTLQEEGDIDDHLLSKAFHDDPIATLAEVSYLFPRHLFLYKREEQGKFQLDPRRGQKETALFRENQPGQGDLEEEEESQCRQREEKAEEKVRRVPGEGVPGQEAEVAEEQKTSQAEGHRRMERNPQESFFPQRFFHFPVHFGGGSILNDREFLRNFLPGLSILVPFASSSL